MAEPRKLRVRLCFFPYAGTSSGTSMCYDITPWSASVVLACERDARVSNFDFRSYADTPITMTRNKAVADAIKDGVDVLMMVDSDMSPDCELGRDPYAKPFFESSFDELYQQWESGPRAICAPYCGPPPQSMPYVFKWAWGHQDIPDPSMKLEMYSREEAAAFKGIQPCAAQPTGLIMFDTRLFELTDPRKGRADGLPYTDLSQRECGWFYYEWTDVFGTTKASTEDVTATRDLSLAGHIKWNRDVLFCNWDAWAGHNKVYCVGKPRPAYANDVSKRYAAAVLESRDSRMKRVILPERKDAGA